MPAQIIAVISHSVSIFRDNRCNRLLPRKQRKSFLCANSFSSTRLKFVASAPRTLPAAHVLVIVVSLPPLMKILPVMFFIRQQKEMTCALLSGEARVSACLCASVVGGREKRKSTKGRTSSCLKYFSSSARMSAADPNESPCTCSHAATARTRKDPHS